MITRFDVSIPELADLPAPPKRIILHWTGGGPKANEVDRKAYHYIVNSDGRVVAGSHPVAANMKKLRENDAYARHTGGFNSFSVSISFAGMAEYGGPSSPGPYPLRQLQVERGVELAGVLCGLWKLDPLNPEQLFTHREAWTLHGVKGKVNHEKRDIEHLPFAPHLGKDEVGPYLRAAASGELILGIDSPAPAAVDPAIPGVAARVVDMERGPAAPPLRLALWDRVASFWRR